MLQIKKYSGVAKRLVIVSASLVVISLLATVLFSGLVFAGPLDINDNETYSVQHTPEGFTLEGDLGGSYLIVDGGSTTREYDTSWSYIGDSGSVTGDTGDISFNNGNYVVLNDDNEQLYFYSTDFEWLGFETRIDLTTTSSEGLYYADDSVFVIDSWNNEVGEYDIDTHDRVNTFDLSSELSVGSDLLYINDSNQWLVSDSDTDRIYVYDENFNFTGVVYDVSRDSSNPISLDFSESGDVAVGDSSSGITVYSIMGEPSDDERLNLDVPNWLDYSSERDYRVIYENESGRFNVTADSTVSSSDESVVSVDELGFTVTATEDESIAARITLTAEYEGLETSENVTVAFVNSSNLEILPGWQRVQAMLSPNEGYEGTVANSLFPFLVMIGMAIAATHFSGAFGGIGAYVMTAVIMWFGGYLQEGGVLIALFVGLFVGLNLAANIDYQVRR